MNGERWLGALCVLFLCVTGVQADQVVGLARLVDGDTLEIRGQAVRLSGIDAPETGQLCTNHRRRSYRCGEAALDALAVLVGQRPVRCVGDEYDRYDRLIATCHVGGRNLNRAMVEAGWAVAFQQFTDLYLPQELDAAKAARGLWQGPFQRPVEHRAERWEAAKQVSPRGCPIKGNISARGKIYHTPWSRWYARTRINTGKGERWFCSEDEALRAGWRAPLR